jgi:hypothetical protein
MGRIVSGLGVDWTICRRAFSTAAALAVFGVLWQHQRSVYRQFRRAGTWLGVLGGNWAPWNRCAGKAEEAPLVVAKHSRFYTEICAAGSIKDFSQLHLTRWRMFSDRKGIFPAPNGGYGRYARIAFSNEGAARTYPTTRPLGVGPRHGHVQSAAVQGMDQSDRCKLSQSSAHPQVQDPR